MHAQSPTRCVTRYDKQIMSDPDQDPFQEDADPSTICEIASTSSGGRRTSARITGSPSAESGFLLSQLDEEGISPLQAFPFHSSTNWQHSLQAVFPGRSKPIQQAPSQGAGVGVDAGAKDPANQPTQMLLRLRRKTLFPPTLPSQGAPQTSSRQTPASSHRYNPWPTPCTISIHDCNLWREHPPPPLLLSLQLNFLCRSQGLRYSSPFHFRETGPLLILWPQPL